MLPTSADSDKVTGITGTYQKHITIMHSILAAHVLLGCDTVGFLGGIGKPTVVNASKNTIPFSSIGKLNSYLQLCETEVTKHSLFCYKQTKVNSVKEARRKV